MQHRAAAPRDPSEMKISPRGAIQTWSSMRERTFRLVL